MKPYYCFLVVTYVSNFAIGFIGNILVLIYLYDSLKKSNQFNKSLAYILINLAVVDILTEIFGTVGVLLEYEVMKHPNGLFGDIVCKTITSHTLTWSFTNISVLTVVLLAWERYRAVTQFKSKAASNLDDANYVKYLLASFWIIGPGVYSPFVPFQIYSEAGGCVEKFTNDVAKYVVSLMDITCFYVIPSIFFLFSYTSIVKSLKKPPKYMSDRRQKQFSYNKVRRKLTRTAMLIVAGFFLCWSGAYIVYTVQVIGNIDTVAVDTAFEVSLILAFFASTSHPIIYSFRSKHFRDKVKDIFSNVKICDYKEDLCWQASKVEPVTNPYVVRGTEETIQGESRDGEAVEDSKSEGHLSQQQSTENK